MDKERFFQLVKQHKTGERVRVLFDMLMELIEASPDDEARNFWSLLKAKLEGEQQAMSEILKSGGSVEAPKVVRKSKKERVPKDKVLDIFEQNGHHVVDTEPENLHFQDE